MAPTTPSNTIVGTTGNDILTTPGSVATLAQGLQGNDTLTLSLGGDWAQAGQGNDQIRISTALSDYSGSIEAGEGDDRVFLTGNIGLTINGGYVGLNAGNDTISFSSGVAFINSTIGAGAGNDSLSFTGNSVRTTLINGGEGADTINLGVDVTFIDSYVVAGQGNDRVLASGLTTDVLSFIGLGQGTDLINLATSVVGTVAGGGLADTITFVGVAGVATVFGDAKGVTVEGTGTGNAADGADLISMSAGFNGTTVYAAGGNDTIRFGAGVGPALIDGGNGADLIGTTAAEATISGLVTVNGGNGHDTIVLNAVANSALVLGGAGNDSVYLLSVSSVNGGSVNGGEGNDTISIGAAAFGAEVTASKFVTVNGGAGQDLVVFNASGAVFTNTGATASLIGQVVFEAGDSIQLGTGLNLQTAQAVNWIGGAATLYVATAISALASANLGTGLGSIGVFDNGDDLVIGIQTGATSSFAVINVIGGDDAIKTTLVAQAVTFSASNFGFTLASSNGSLAISFT